MASANPSIPDEIDAALAWWRAAGVDQDFGDDATVWLADPAVETVAQTGGTAAKSIAAAADDGDQQNSDEAAAKRIILGDQPPADLDSFRDWWLTEPGLDTVGPRGRVPPRGAAGADLMILVIDPEPQDREHLLSGPGGNLLKRFLTACQVDEANVYFASALTRHTPMADTQALAKAGLGAVLHHHIQLVAPKRLLAFGGNILPLIGNDVPKSGKNLREINSSAPNTPFLMSEGLASLMASPRLKARFWRRWIEWSADI